ncbi:MAG: outer membrane beta-barrel protein [Muribaculaceae bacterium]|nr:outer membrane beta-barrel protein [Muribaculaceae bacterium]
MKRLLSSFFVMAVIVSFAAENQLYLRGRVKESLGKTDLIHAYVVRYDSIGNVIDSIQANQGLAWRNGAIDTTSVFSFPVPRVDSTYVFDVVCKGYKPLTMSYSVNKIGKREDRRDIGTIYLDRAPIMLNEVTVTSSKIKFYNDGDTIVYNADAFQLAEGSMLDALISQLPGVELNTNGQIKVNGDFVESLLLNGKQFFDGNNNLMLENIAAYTVKDIKVYDAPTKKDVLMGNDNNKVLTMNVLLKKEYNYGWLVNAQGGYGSENRYLARLFASWFNSTTRITTIGNVNNLNNNRKPGRDDTWTPEEMPDGAKSVIMGGINYNYEHPEGTTYADGNIMFNQVNNNVARTSNRINFIPGGDTYENSFADNHDRSTALSTQHYFNKQIIKPLSLGLNLAAGYNYEKNNAATLSATFSSDPGEMSRQMLEAIYSNGDAEKLATILNHANTKSDGWNKAYNISFSPYFLINLPHSNDRMYANVGVSYNSSKADLWRDYVINYGASMSDAEKRRQYTDNSPNHELNLYGGLRYSTNFKHIYFTAYYSYLFSEKTKDSYMYALDKLNDMGIYGTLPTDYITAFDPLNSFESKTIQNKHSIKPEITFYTDIKDKTAIHINVMPEIALVHRNFNYWTNQKNYHLSKSNVAVNVQGYWEGMIQVDFGKLGEGRQAKYRNSLRYSYSSTPTLPDMYDMIDIVNDANPLNIYIGNPDLKMAWRHRHLFRWHYMPHSHPTFNNILYMSYTHASNSLTRGYTYDTTSGIRYNKMYNVNGNRTWALTNELSWQFGAKKQFTLSSYTDGVLATYNDMIGTNGNEPQKVTVQNNSITENVKLGWQIGRQSIALRCDFMTRQTSSEQPDFNTINATHVNYGLSGTFILPAGFSLSTDFTCYMRRGYGTPTLDTTDPVWNARISYVPLANKHWVFMLDGFDLLHQLSNVNYAVTASGRTVSYSNVIPRYVMLSVQYRLNIQPKKR